MAHVYPPTFGSDGTALIQAGIDTGDEYVYVHAGLYLLTSPVTFSDVAFENDTPGALEATNNQTIILLEGAHLKAAVGSFKGKYQAMIRVNEKSNSHIKLERGSHISMRKEHYTVANGYTLAEWRHCVRFIGCTDYSIVGEGEAHLDNPGGDCLILEGVNLATPALRTTNIRGHIAGIILDRGHRQGMSVLSANTLTVNNCAFNNVLGTAPQSGCDLEPPHPVDVLIDIVFNRCTFNTNPSRHLFFNFDLMNPSGGSVSSPVSMTFNNCIFEGGNTNWGIDFKCATGSGPPSGFITFNDCSVCNTPYAAIRAVWDSACNVIVTFNNLNIYNCSRKLEDTPIDLTFTGTPSTVGKFLFTGNCTVHETMNRRITTVTASIPITNVQGKIRLDRLNRPVTTEQFDPLLPNLVIEPYAKDTRFLEKVYHRQHVARRSFS